MEFFVSRLPIGCLTSGLEGVIELEAQLKRIGKTDKFRDDSEISVEIQGTWAEIRELFSQSCFKTAWFDPKKLPKSSEDIPE